MTFLLRSHPSHQPSAVEFCRTDAWISGTETTRLEREPVPPVAPPAAKSSCISFQSKMKPLRLAHAVPAIPSTHLCLLITCQRAFSVADSAGSLCLIFDKHQVTVTYFSCKRVCNRRYPSAKSTRKPSKAPQVELLTPRRYGQRWD